MSQPLSSELLLDWLEGRLAAEASEAVARRLAAADAPTRARAAWLERFLAVRREVVLAEPPPELHAALLRQFQPLSPHPGAPQRVHASLSFDSALQPGLVGVRSLDLRTRQLVFACDLVEIAMSVRPAWQSDRLDLNGQVYPRLLPSTAGLLVRLTRADDLMDLSITSELGEFSFAALPPGAYQLDLMVEESQVELESFVLELGPSL
jgi:hypothetical protein